VTATVAPVRARLRQALVEAMKARDTVAVSALRSALAAIDNAEAVKAADGQQPAPVAGPHVAGAVAGLGAAEVPRRGRTACGVGRVLRTEVVKRLAGADEYERLGQPEAAQRLRTEAQVLRAVLS
jgi:uncharacterized protein YqeY